MGYGSPGETLSERGAHGRLHAIEVTVNWIGASPPILAHVRYRFDGHMYVGEKVEVCTFSQRAMDGQALRPDVCKPWRDLGETPLPPLTWEARDDDDDF